MYTANRSIGLGKSPAEDDSMLAGTLAWTLEFAAESGRVAGMKEVVEKARELKCNLFFTNIPYNDGVCCAAVRSGSIDCLQYAIDLGCPANFALREAAAHANEVFSVLACERIRFVTK